VSLSNRGFSAVFLATNPQSEIRNPKSQGGSGMSSSNNSNNNSKSHSGRPRALDDVKRREIVALITAGFSIDRAARYVGCAASTIRRESIRNQQFQSDMRRASLSAELSPLQAVREAGRKYWRAAAWLLERMDPQRFGKQDVRCFKPEQLEATVDVFSRIIASEVSSPQERLRIVQKVEVLLKRAERMVWINHNTPPSRPRRKRQRPDELSPEARLLLAEVDRAVDGRAPQDLDQVTEQFTNQ
jgi:hypothetical protein